MVQNPAVVLLCPEGTSNQEVIVEVIDPKEATRTGHKVELSPRSRNMCRHYTRSKAEPLGGLPDQLGAEAWEKFINYCKEYELKKALHPHTNFGLHPRGVSGIKRSRGYPAAPLVRRKARDGKLYSWKQFLQWYGDISWSFAASRWERAGFRK